MLEIRAQRIEALLNCVLTVRDLEGLNGGIALIPSLAKRFHDCADVITAIAEGKPV